jgi:Tfp pilus assembly protein PilV
MAHLTKIRGAAFIEVLASVAIIALSLLAALSLYGFSLGMTEKTADEAISYNLARKSLENARQLGFSYLNLPEGTTNLYYDSMGNNPSAAQTSVHKFKLTRAVSSDKYTTLADGTVRPSDTAVRTVIIEVRRIKDTQLLHQVATHLVRSGV